MSDATATMEQEQATRSQADAFELLLKPENQEALREIVEQLPKLATMMALFGKLYDVSAEALTDGDLMGAVEEIVRAKTKPLTKTYGDLSAAIQEAKARADADQASYGVFSVLKMLKDPSVQKNLKFVFAFLSVWGERTKVDATDEK